MILQRRFFFTLAVVLVAVSSSRPLAQLNASQPSGSVLAIVGARIVDGSGNEPFAGTVVVRDGRIAEVGRTVRPPESARIIDAHGRTVTPGLIDVRVHLPAGATDEALARLMAAFLNAGVTSIGVADLDESKLDALRDHLSIARIRAPRLVAATAPANAMLASSLGSSMPDASALADWKKRNATFIPELLLGAASDKTLALDRLRAAQQAGVRVAVGSNAGAPNLPAGTSTAREMRLLLEGGLTPLQALTAVTSGSAWALGLQSDRAFLAVGQRGDLAILAGEPSATSGDAPLVEQVFVGGEEIDRAALNAIITRPEPAPPETTAASTAPAGAGAPGSTTAEPVKRGASGKASRTGRKGHSRSGSTDTAPASAPSPAPAAGAGASPSATAEHGSSSAREPTASTTPPAAAPPTAAPPATAVRAATPSTATSGSTAPAAPPASGSAAAAAAPIPVADPLIDDFENGGSDGTGLAPIWNASNDSGSTSNVIVGRVIRGLRDHALHVTARMGESGEPYARITVELSHDGHPADVSQYRGLRFEARGQGRYRVVFVTRGVSDGRYHESYFSGSPLWTPVSIPFATLGQTGAGSHVKWTGTDLIEIAFHIARDPGQIGWLELDNLRFY